jgi:hypothetical protein
MTLEEIRARIPLVAGCIQCGDCCGHVPASLEEFGRIKLWAEEKQDCRFLENGKCTIYDERPIMCRLFGLHEELRCPHGARGDRDLMIEEIKLLFAEYDKLLDEGEVWL